ncbi:MAG TPA: LamB/YcsF family protein, partial [Kofleriaceae bacterium]
VADVLSVACGGHADDEQSMTRIARFCAGKQRPRIGAHPSYPDREGFGRRSLRMEPDALRLTVAAQCRALAAIAAAHGQRVGWVKPHGALYHDAARNEVMSRELLDGVREALGTEPVIIGPATGWLRETSTALGMQYLREGFADRATCPDGSLVPRNEPGALITDPQLAAARARELVGTVDTICVHADTPGALAIARAVREAIDG